MLVISIKEAKQKLEERWKPSVVNAMLRKAMKEVAEATHKYIIPGHFGREAYIKYRHIWPAFKQKPAHKGGALYITGNLKRNILERTNVRAIRGQINVRLVMKMGRPAKYTGDSLKDQVKKYMIWLNTSYKNAEAYVLSFAGYGEKLRRDFERKITYLTKEDKKTIAQWMGLAVLYQMKMRTKGGRIKK